MKQEDKDLLLRDLSARLTYGVKVVRYIERNNKVEQLIPEMDLSLRLFELSISNQWFIIKPYLRPISSLTDEEKIELQKAFNIKSSIIGEYGISSNNAWWVKDRKEPLGFDTIRYTSFCCVTDYLNSIHVDYRGLIERGLAIKVTPDNNPYE